MSLKIINEIQGNSKKLFLIDGLGAMFSATLYTLVLANFYSFFGIPIKELYFLGFLAVIYATYSFTCYIKDLNHWQSFMKAIAIANLFHCCLTIGLLIYYYQQITMWGMLYFIGEFMIVIPLAILELKTSSAESPII